MQPFKPYFRGEEEPPSRRLTSCQKCFRTVDIEDVGHHHAAPHVLRDARQLLDRRLLQAGRGRVRARALDARSASGSTSSDIWITVFGGDEELGLGPDEEAIECWRAVGVPDERIVRLGLRRQLLAVRPDRAVRPLLGALPRPRARLRPGRRPPGRRHRALPRVLEPRVHAVRAARRRLADRRCPAEHRHRAGARPDGGDPPGRPVGLRDRPLRAAGRARRGAVRARSTARTSPPPARCAILADHGRAPTFLLADGVVPSNEDRGYVLRRIMRRAIQQGRVLGIEPSRSCVRAVRARARRDGRRLPGPRARAGHDRALGARRGGELRPHARAGRAAARRAGRSARRRTQTSWVSAEDAFKLHDTYGFPYELTKELLAEEGLAVDDQGFEELMERAREVSRAAARARARRRRGRRPRSTRSTTTCCASRATPASRRASWATRRPRPTPCCARPSATTAGCSPSSRRARSTPRAAARSPTAGLVETPSGRARVVDVYRLGDDQALALEPVEGELGAGEQRARGRGARHAPRHDAQPHRHPPAARRAARAPRHARAPGGLLRRPRQAALRLHARRAALAPRTWPTVEQLVNGWIAANHPVRAIETTRDEAERARGDGAVRREVRRLGADGRDRGRLARAVRRHARGRAPPRSACST